MSNDLDFVEINRHGFQVLIKPFPKLSFKDMMPIMDLAATSPDSPKMFGLLVKAFVKHLPIDKVEEFEGMSLQEATDIIQQWMETPA